MTLQSIVLLRNPIRPTAKSAGAVAGAREGSEKVLEVSASSVLPFKAGMKVAVIGPHANATKEMVGNYLGQICPSSPSGGGAGGLSRTTPHGDGGFGCVKSPYAAIAELNNAAGGSTTFSYGCV